MARLKELLVTNYIGAIVIGLVAAQGVNNLIGAVLYAVEWPFLGRRGGSVFAPAVFPTSQVVQAVAGAIAYLGMAFLLLRWLYAQPRSPEPADKGLDA